MRLCFGLIKLQRKKFASFLIDDKFLRKCIRLKVHKIDLPVFLSLLWYCNTSIINVFEVAFTCSFASLLSNTIIKNISNQ